MPGSQNQIVLGSQNQIMLARGWPPSTPFFTGLTPIHCDIQEKPSVIPHPDSEISSLFPLYLVQNLSENLRLYSAVSADLFDLKSPQ